MCVMVVGGCVYKTRGFSSKSTVIRIFALLCIPRVWKKTSISLCTQEDHFSLTKGRNRKVKKQNENFEVPMGAYDGAEICELVGTYLLSFLNSLRDKGVFGQQEVNGLKPQCTQPGVLYGLCTVHKVVTEEIPK